MQPSAQQLNEWEAARAAAVRAAWRAWREVIEPLYLVKYHIHEKVDGPCTEADKNADRFIVECLSADYPQPAHGYLTEESEAQASRLNCKRVWIIDPIDGTKEFIKKNGNFAIHIALVEELEPGIWHPVAAAVYIPVSEQMYSAIRSAGAWRAAIPNSVTEAAALPRREAIHVSNRAELAQMRSPVSNSHRESRLMRLIHSLQLADHWHVGSLGVKIAQIAEGNAELYVNLALGRAKEWDTCAPHLILAEAGGKMTDLEGGIMTYNNADFVLRRGILASNGPAHDLLIQRVQDFLAADAKTHP